MEDVFWFVLRDVKIFQPYEMTARWLMNLKLFIVILKYMKMHKKMSDMFFCVYLPVDKTVQHNDELGYTWLNYDVFKYMKINMQRKMSEIEIDELGISVS